MEINKKDLDFYNDLNEQELLRIQSHIANIRHQRQEKINFFLKEKDAVSLKSLLEKNSMQLTSEHLDELYFYGVTQKDFEFIDYILSSKAFEKSGNKNQIWEKILYDAYKDPVLFDKMFPKYYMQLHSFKEYAIKNRDTSYEIIDKLFKEGALSYSFERFLETLESNGFAYVQYCLDKDFIKDVSKEEMFTLHSVSLKIMPEELFDDYCKKFPEILNVKLEYLISGALGDDDYYKDNYKNFIKHVSPATYGKIIKNFEFGDMFIVFNMAILNNLKKEDYIIAFMDSLCQKDRALLEIVKDNLSFVSQPDMKKLFEKLYFGLTLENNLENKELLAKVKI